MLIEYTKNGRRVNANRQVAKVLIGKGLARAVDEEATTPATPTYQTRMMQAAPAEAAPYGYKADGTPRKRPGRPAAAE